MPDSDSNLRLLQKAPALIWRAGLDAGCYWFNDTWLAFRGRSLEQEFGNGWAEGVHPDDFEPCLAIYLDAFAKRQSFEMEYRILRYDGSYRWILDHGIPSDDFEGVFDGYVGYCFDITYRKVMEEALKERKNELEAANIELQDARRKLERLALFDDLTGLPNRYNILRQFEEEIARHPNRNISIFMIDVDHFKSINDRFGHFIGDECLKEIGGILSKSIRSSDIVGRFGGEEFVVLLPETGNAVAHEVATKLCKDVAAFRGTVLPQGVMLTVSIGETTFQGDMPVDFSSLMRQADQALYAAKAAGRNRVVMTNASAIAETTPLI